MDANTNTLITAVWVGLVIGLILMCVITLITLPASFLMNTFSYHSPYVRALIMMYSGGVFIITFLIIAFSAPENILYSLNALIPNFLLLFTRVVWRPAHYFGLFPLYDYNEGAAEPTGYFASAMKFLLLAIHPFVMTFDKIKIEESLDQILADPSTLPEPIGKFNETSVFPGIVNEAFTMATIDAGNVGDDWDTSMTALEGIGKLLYGHKGTITLGGAKKEVAPAASAAANVDNVVSKPPPPIPSVDDGKFWYYDNKYVGTCIEVEESRDDKDYIFTKGNVTIGDYDDNYKFHSVDVAPT